MRLKDILFAVAIMILTIFVTFYGINTIFPKANYDDYCGIANAPKLVQTEQECLNENGTWVYQERQCVTTPCPQGYCEYNTYDDCWERYEEVNQARSKYVFFLALPLGILIVILGMFFGLEAVGTGLMGGGIGTLIYGAGAFWPYTENWIRFVFSLVGLVALIWFAYYLNKRLSKKGKKK